MTRHSRLAVFGVALLAGFGAATLHSQDRRLNPQLRIAHMTDPAVAFTVRSHGGKCLAFTVGPQASGSPVFLDACGNSDAQKIQPFEINAQRHVVLRAGQKVIGVRGMAPASSTPQPTGPVVRDHRGDPVRRRAPPAPRPDAPPPIVRDHRGENLPPASGTPAMALELQDAQNPPPPGQVFVLDGDSIILESDRSRVVMVDGNRGANGTALVVGPRELADAEFWTLSPTDGSSRPPTRGFVRVADRAGFMKAIEGAGPGTVIDVDPGVSIDLTATYVALGAASRFAADAAAPRQAPS